MTAGARRCLARSVIRSAFRPLPIEYGRENILRKSKCVAPLNLTAIPALYGGPNLGQHNPAVTTFLKPGQLNYYPREGT